LLLLYITLKPGFHAQAGSDFLATIMACNNSLEETILFSKRTKADEDELLENINFNMAESGNSTQVAEVKEIPLKAHLQVMPNPTRSWTTFKFDLPYQTRASIYIFSASGQQVTCLYVGLFFILID